MKKIKFSRPTLLLSILKTIVKNIQLLTKKHNIMANICKMIIAVCLTSIVITYIISQSNSPMEFDFNLKNQAVIKVKKMITK